MGGGGEKCVATLFLASVATAVGARRICVLHAFAGGGRAGGFTGGAGGICPPVDIRLAAVSAAAAASASASALIVSSIAMASRRDGSSPMEEEDGASAPASVWTQSSERTARRSDRASADRFAVTATRLRDAADRPRALSLSLSRKTLISSPPLCHGTLTPPLSRAPLARLTSLAVPSPARTPPVARAAG